MSLSLYQYHSEPESLYGFDQAMNSVPHLAWKHYRGDVEELKKREHIWARSAEYSYRYARYVLEERFPAGEPAIAGDAQYSFLYARDVLGGRFPEGEPAIAGDAHYGYLYALDVLEERFPAGEPAIAGYAEYSYRYARYVLEERFPAGEPAIRGSKYQQDYEQLFGIKL